MRRSGTLMLVLCAIILVAVALILHRAGGSDEGHITLLTVSEDAEGAGGTADLYLTVKPGTGAVYMDSFPLTRIDTQGSMRYANRLACDMLERDCTTYDFFYRIRANSALVGGPSAGAAMAVLTVAVLDGRPIDQHTAMTGTINSGGIIGPVAGIDAKVKGAKRTGVTRVLVPAILSSEETDDTRSSGTDKTWSDSTRDGTIAAPTDTNVSGNTSVSEDVTIQRADPAGTTRSGSDDSGMSTTPPVMQVPLERGRIDRLSDADITVIGVGTVEEALLLVTGKIYARGDLVMQAPEEYEQRMDSIADEICKRMLGLEDVVRARHLAYNDTHNYSKRIAAVDEHHDYSRASLCFSKNIDLATLILEDSTRTERSNRLRELRDRTDALENETRSRTITTIGDLEAYAIVIERVLEAKELLYGSNAREPANLAYAQERLVSAQSWSRFFGMPGNIVQPDDAYLRVACLAKLSEAEERINYVRLYTPTLLDESEQEYEKAQGYARDEPVLCIFTATKAKAQADVLGAAITIGEENVDALLSQKIEAAQRALAKEQARGFFPILGYSYSQYAQDLRATVPYSGLIFSEYALELSNLHMYFPPERPYRLSPGVEETLAVFIFGMLFGAGVILFIIGRGHTAVVKESIRSQRGRRHKRERSRRT